AERSGIRAGGPGGGGAGHGHHRQAHFAQLHGAHHRAVVAAGGFGHFVGGGARLSRPRRAAAGARMGYHPEPRPAVHYGGAAHYYVHGPGHQDRKSVV